MGSRCAERQCVEGMKYETTGYSGSWVQWEGLVKGELFIWGPDR